MVAEQALLLRRRSRGRSVFLQLFLEFLLLLFVHLRIGRRAVERLGEIGERQRKAHRRIVEVDGLDVEGLALLELVLQVVADLVEGDAAFETGDELGRRIRLLLLIDQDARAVFEQHAERKRDAQNLRRALRLGVFGERRRRGGLGAQDRARDANLLRRRLAQLHPWRGDELQLRRRSRLRGRGRRRGRRLRRRLGRRLRLGRWCLRVRGSNERDRRQGGERRDQRPAGALARKHRHRG